MFQRLKDLITQHQQIGIVVSPNPSFDDMAAGLGMYLALTQMGKNVAIVSPTDPTVAVSSLVGIDKVAKGFGAVSGGSNGDLVVSFPYREGEIEKVSYTVDNGQLNIVVKAGAQGLSFSQTDVRFQQGGASAGQLPPLLFYIGVADKNSVASVTGANPTGVTTVNIDNKPTNTGYGDVVHVSPKFTSVSEQVADFLTLLEPQIELDRDTAQNLLSGILASTSDFQNGQGSYLAFEMAGILMKKGAVRKVNGAVAQPAQPAMETSNYFPPAGQSPLGSASATQMPTPQPMANFFTPAPTMQNAQSVAQQPTFGGTQSQQAPSFQPAQEPVAQQPFGSTQGQGPTQPAQPFGQQQNPQQQPPADWLTPKVYKGSTVL